MKYKKIIIFTLLCILAFIYINKPFSNNYPTYIDDFIKNNPQAKSLKTNFQNYENNDPINLKYDGSFPQLLQWDKRWAYTSYGKEIVGTAGCGPTCLAMVVIELTHNTTYNPRYIAKYATENNYLEGSKTKWSLMEKGCEVFGIKATLVPLNENIMRQRLNQNNPIICSVGPGDFTKTGHFIVITKTKNNLFYISDPNNLDNNKKGWSYKQLAPQIKAMWSYSTIQ